jgi:hypothetical protein
VQVPPAPPVPTPFPSLGDASGADGTIDAVLLEKKPAIVLSSKIPNTKGDEASNKKGLVSSTNLKEVEFKVGSSKVYAKGKKMVPVTALTTQNKANAVGNLVSVDQQKVFISL